MLRNVDTDGLKMLKKSASKLRQAQQHYSGCVLEENELDRIINKIDCLIARIENHHPILSTF